MISQLYKIFLPFASFIVVSFSPLLSRKIDSPQKLNFSSIEHKFKYHDLKKFEIDTISWDQRAKFYNLVDSINYISIIQDSSKYYYGQLNDTMNLDLDFYYSIQHSKRNLIELTFLSQREGEYCTSIYYNLYNLDGKLISSFLVARSCGDAGYYEIAKGKFLNDTTYELLSEDNYVTQYIENGDSVTYSKTLTVIKPNGAIVQTDIVLNNN